MLATAVVQTFFSTVSVWLACSHVGYLFRGIRTKLLLPFPLSLANDYIFDLLGHLYFGYVEGRTFQLGMFLWHAFKYTPLHDLVSEKVWLVTNLMDSLIWVYVAYQQERVLLMFIIFEPLYLALLYLYTHPIHHKDEHHKHA